MRFHWKIYSLLLWLLVSCTAYPSPTPIATPFSSTPTPYSQIPTPYVKMYKGEFLFVVVSGNDYCECGGCFISEQVAPPFEIEHKRLTLHDLGHYSGFESWDDFQSQYDFIGLSIFQKEWSMANWETNIPEFGLIQQLPYSALSDMFVIQQVRSPGDISLLIEDKLIDLKVDDSLKITVIRQDQGLSCPVAHEYTLTNYGFIFHENVELINYPTP